MTKNRAIGFSSSKGLPKATENKDKKLNIIKWGEKNDYPFFEVEMYHGSAWHQGIINAKRYYIAGAGFKNIPSELVTWIENSFSDFTIDEILQDAVLDYEIFNGMCVVGTWNREGSKIAKWEHLDFDKCRLSICGEYVMYSEDWGSRKQDEETGYREIPLVSKNNKEGEVAIYYRASSKQEKGERGAYPKPTYVGGLTSINTDYLISKYHLHEIQNGFKGGTLVNFANGQPETTEEENAIRDQVKGSSTNIEDTNTVVITFSDGNDNAPSVLQLNGNDLADRYNMTEKSVQQNILVAHTAINPLLFGIKTEGQLGGGQELETSYEIFKNLYVSSRQRDVEYVFNYMAELSGFNVNLELESPLPIGKKVVEEQQTRQFSEQDDLSVFSQFGEDKSKFRTLKSIPIRNDFEMQDVEAMEMSTVSMFDTIGQIRASLGELDRNILNLIAKGEDTTNIAKALEVPLKDVVESVEKMKGLNLVNAQGVSDLADGLLETIQDEIIDYEVRYSYEVKPGLGADVIPTTRDFCRELIRQNRMYTRQEIMSISARIGRDVFRYRGGFYHNPDTDRTTPWCRHEWKQNVVVKN